MKNTNCLMLAFLTMPITFNVDDVPFDASVLLRLWADGKGPNVPDFSKFTAIRFYWENGDLVSSIETTSGISGTDLLVHSSKKLKDLLPRLSKTKLLRVLCIFICVYEDLTMKMNEFETTLSQVSYPLETWVAEALSGGFIPLQEVNEKLLSRFLELISNIKEKVAEEKVAKLREIYSIWTEFEETPVNVALVTALRTAMVICDNFEKKEGEELLDRFNEELQNYYEVQIETFGLGDVEKDAEFLKKLFGSVKEVYEQTPIVLKKKKKKKKAKKAKPPPIPPFPSKEKLIALGYEVIVWDGGDINEQIVLRS